MNVVWYITFLLLFIKGKKIKLHYVLIFEKPKYPHKTGNNIIERTPGEPHVCVKVNKSYKMSDHFNFYEAYSEFC